MSESSFQIPQFLRKDPTVSDTPRTDAIVKARLDYTSDESVLDDYRAMVKLARELERELENVRADKVDDAKAVTPTATERLAIVDRVMREWPYTRYSYVAQNDTVENERANKYARSIALAVLAALSVEKGEKG